MWLNVFSYMKNLWIWLFQIVIIITKLKRCVCTVFLCNLLGKNKELKVFPVTCDALLMFHAWSNFGKKNRLLKFKLHCSFVTMFLHNFIPEAFTCYTTCSSSEINFSFIKSLRGENKRWFLFPPFIVLSWQLKVRHW